MEREHDIVRQVRAAKTDNAAADALIEKYMPFIKAETWKFLQRPPVEGQDDELSIAMIAFHEAVLSYASVRGPFLKYAALLIRSRLIDYQRREKRNSGMLSLETPVGDGDTAWGELIPDTHDYAGELVLREATRDEIVELTVQMKGFGVSLADVADNCPRQHRTLEACRRVVRYMRSQPDLMQEFLRTGKLPMAKICAGSGAERKTLERHRKYLVALLLIQTNGYEILRGHLAQVMKGAGEE